METPGMRMLVPALGHNKIYGNYFLLHRGLRYYPYQLASVQDLSSVEETITAVERVKMGKIVKSITPKQRQTLQQKACVTGDDSVAREIQKAIRHYLA